MPGSVAASHIGLHHRDAVRLLFILALGSEEAGDGERIFRGEKRAMAIDFLVRYPDYLADELITRYETKSDQEALDAAVAIFDADEPDERTVAMVRWRRGAFQNIEMPLSILTAYGLVRPLRQTAGQRRHDFVVLPAAFAFIERIEREQPTLRWYRSRVDLVMTLTAFRSGSDLKGDQYLHPEYRDARHGTEIPSIKERVLDRLKAIRGRP
ncbi:hypothetical protein MKK55_17950 [Methylobacterium sp. J-059]|uniref:hypothetical protein n=1 Tax=Methylobacterium sp. J-059 TaxID=2836643 RepID=UPI001FB92A79|nr:hypothetical protein [Methylobacterium sp. J-059]MCJ2040817.1 hypothetical protein [Methylobacterium sp. J-059]